MKDVTIPGLFWLLGWYCLTLLPFAGAGSVLWGIPGAVGGLLASTVIGVAGFGAYMRYGGLSGNAN